LKFGFQGFYLLSQFFILGGGHGAIGLGLLQIIEDRIAAGLVFAEGSLQLLQLFSAGQGFLARQVAAFARFCQILLDAFGGAQAFLQFIPLGRQFFHLRLQLRCAGACGFRFGFGGVQGRDHGEQASENPSGRYRHGSLQNGEGFNTGWRRAGSPPDTAFEL